VALATCSTHASHVRCHANYFIKNLLESTPFGVNHIRLELLRDTEGSRTHLPSGGQRLTTYASETIGPEKLKKALIFRAFWGEAAFLSRFPSFGRGCRVYNPSGYQEQTPNESDSIPEAGIESTYLPGSSVPRLMILI